MPGTQLEQTKRAIKALKSVGFSRNEFSVQTPFDHSRGGYGKVKISIKYFAEEKAVELAKEIAETKEFDVTIFDTGKSKFALIEDGFGKLEEAIYNEKTKSFDWKRVL